MKKLLQSTIVRVVCQVLVLAMISTLIPSGLTTKAYAQSGSALGSDPAKKVGVVEFINDSNKFGQIVSKNATSAFIMECNKDSRVFQVEASSEEIQAKMDELGIRHPASKLDCIALAKELGLDGIVQGFIKSVSVKGQGAGKIATANVVIQYIDKASGEILMGTNAKGESSARIGFTADEDTLVVEAISKAISIALFNLSNYNIPKATIHANAGEGGNIILNAGSRNNLYPGLRMVVMRGAYPVIDDNLPTSTKVSEMRVVGYIEIESVTGLDATARIISQNVGIKPEDICLGLYSDVYVSKYSPVEETQNNVNSKGRLQAVKAKNNATQVGYILLGVAAAVGLACLFSSKGGDGGESGPNVEPTKTPGQLQIKENTNGYISGKIIGLRVRKDKATHVDFWNGDVEEQKTSGEYDGKKDVYLNVFNIPELAPDVNEQASYTAQWIYIYQKPNTEETTIEYSDASGSAKWTKLSAPSNLEPSTNITANNFEVGEAFVWDCPAISDDKVNIQYKVEIWDTSSSKKLSFTTKKKYLNASELQQVWDYFTNTDYTDTTFAWRVGVQNTKDSNAKAFWWSKTVQFGIDELPPAPPTKGIKRSKK